ncbi:MAG TPA: hypothetical protein VK174_01690 [Chitinophagales bacterium]|nr:hypothetical protein [Chitinophagales bacterium]
MIITHHKLYKVLAAFITAMIMTVFLSACGKYPVKNADVKKQPGAIVSPVIVL